MQLIAPYIFKETEIHNSIKKEHIDYEDKDDFNFLEIYQIAWTLNQQKNLCPLLASIDPYDNTIFNFNQCELLILEIEIISKSNEKISNLEKIKKLTSSIERGQYLLLMGD